MGCKCKQLSSFCDSVSIHYCDSQIILNIFKILLMANTMQLLKIYVCINLDQPLYEHKLFRQKWIQSWK